MTKCHCFCTLLTNYDMDWLHQTGFVVAGHKWSVFLIHERIRWRYPRNGRQGKVNKSTIGKNPFSNRLNFHFGWSFTCRYYLHSRLVPASRGRYQLHGVPTRDLLPDELQRTRWLSALPLLSRRLDRTLHLSQWDVHRGECHTTPAGLGVFGVPDRWGWCQRVKHVWYYTSLASKLKCPHRVMSSGRCCYHPW